MNTVALIGRLTADPEIRYTQSGKAVASYRLAVDREFKSEGQPTADFIPCVAWGRNAEFVQKYLHKGMKIGVTGRIQTGSYKKDDGSTVYTTDIIVDNHHFCESKGGGSGSGSTRDINELSQYPETQFTDVGSADDGELPF